MHWPLSRCRRGHDISFTLGSLVLRLPEPRGLIFNFQLGKTLRTSSEVGGSVGRPGLPGDVREPGVYGVQICRATDWVGWNRRAYFPRGYDGGGAGFSAPLRSPCDRFPADPFARGGPAGPFRDALLSSGWLPHPIPGLDGGG